MTSPSEAPTVPQPVTRRWTTGQKWFVVLLVVLCVGISVPAFVEIFQTATHLVRPYLKSLDWTVPVSGEIAFVFAFLCGVLLAWRKAPAGAARGLIMAVIATGSIVLQAYAGRKHLPDLVGHLVIVCAFFGVILVGKSTLMTLAGGKVRADRIGAGEWVAHPLQSFRLWRWKTTWGEPSRDKALDRYMALLFARTIAQADPRVGRGRRWRRNLPDVLRYQFSTGLFPTAILASIAYGGAWQEAVTEHVTEQLRQLDPRHPEVTDEISERVTARDTDQSTAEDMSEGTAEGTAGSTPEGTTGDTRRATADAKTGDTDKSTWPTPKEIEPAVLARMIRTAANRYGREHDGDRIPDAKLSELIKVRMARATAKQYLVKHYGAPAKAGLHAAR